MLLTSAVETRTNLLRTYTLLDTHSSSSITAGTLGGTQQLQVFTELLQASSEKYHAAPAMSIPNCKLPENFQTRGGIVFNGREEDFATDGAQAPLMALFSLASTCRFLLCACSLLHSGD
jgi:hypothetical protein